MISHPSYPAISNEISAGPTDYPTKEKLDKITKGDGNYKERYIAFDDNHGPSQHTCRLFSRYLLGNAPFECWLYGPASKLYDSLAESKS